MRAFFSIFIKVKSYAFLSSVFLIAKKWWRTLYSLKGTEKLWMSGFGESPIGSHQLIFLYKYNIIEISRKNINRLSWKNELLKKKTLNSDSLKKSVHNTISESVKLYQERFFGVRNLLFLGNV